MNDNEVKAFIEGAKWAEDEKRKTSMKKKDLARLVIDELNSICDKYGVYVAQNPSGIALYISETTLDDEEAEICSDIEYSEEMTQYVYKCPDGNDEVKK